MTRSVWATGFEPRLDKKCGNGAISEHEECRSGPAASNKPSIGRAAATGAKIGAVYGSLYGAGVSGTIAHSQRLGTLHTVGTAAAGAGIGAASHAVPGALLGAGVGAIQKAMYNPNQENKKKKKNRRARP